MKAKMPAQNDNNWLGNMNAASRAAVWKGKKIVGYCIDTPNSAAYAMSKTGGDKVTGRYSTYCRKDMINRVNNAGWFTNDKSANFMKA